MQKKAKKYFDNKYINPLTIVIMVGMVICLIYINNTRKSLDNIVYMDINHGRVTIKMYPSVAPIHVMRIKQLVRANFYKGIAFHRVIPGFMAQTGDPTATGSGGTGLKLPAEFSMVKYTRGTVGMARTSDPNSGDSQFFITYNDKSSFLNNKYTVWGQVIDGMKWIDKIKPGEPPEYPDRIIQMKMASDEYMEKFTLSKSKKEPKNEDLSSD